MADREFNYAVCDSGYRPREFGDARYGHHKGHVISEFGLVEVVQSWARPEDRENRQTTTFTFVWRGRVYVKHVERLFTERAAVIRARKWAASIAGTTP